MSARPPPARPHVGLNPSSRFGSYSISDWGEDDAWDSGSDEESSASAAWKQSSGRSATSSAPRPVPKPKSNRSSSTIASSYTHVDAPSPSSYPSRTEEVQPPAKQGWTIVRTSSKSSASGDRQEAGDTRRETHGDPEVEGDLILGEMDSEEISSSVEHPAPTKAKFSQGSVREDVGEIVKGTALSRHVRCTRSPLTCCVDPLHLVRRKPRQGSSQTPPRSSDSQADEKLMRERSIRSNRRQKFVNCITSEDVSMGSFVLLCSSGQGSDTPRSAAP